VVHRIDVTLDVLQEKQGLHKESYISVVAMQMLHASLYSNYKE